MANPFIKSLAKLGDEIKSISAPFSGYGGNGYGYGWGSAPLYSMGGNGGGDLDYRSLAGDLWGNSAVAACLIALTDAFAQADPILERRNGNAWERIDHDLIDMLQVPNDGYSSKHLWGLTLVSEKTNGKGFWRIVRDRAGRPAQIWFEPPPLLGAATFIAPRWNSQEFISGYAYYVDGRETALLEKEDVVYFRHLLDIRNPRHTWNPLATGTREVATLNAASAYTGAVMANGGAMRGFISSDDPNVEITAEQAVALKAKANNDFKGERAGEWFVSNLKVKPYPLSWSPDELALKDIIRMPLSTVCALLRTPMDVALLNMGEHATYENLDASMRWWWDNHIIPLEDGHANVIETYLFPLFGLDRREYRMSWDRSRVPALQDDWVQLWKTVMDAYGKGAIDLHQAQAKLGFEPKPEMIGVFSSKPPQGDEMQNDETKSAKSDDELPPWTQEEIDAMSDDINEDDLKRVLGTTTDPLNELLKAKPDKKNA